MNTVEKSGKWSKKKNVIKFTESDLGTPRIKWVDRIAGSDINSRCWDPYEHRYDKNDKQNS